MEKGIFEKNRRKNRRMALVMTVLFHIAVLGGLWYSSSEGESPFNDLFDQITDGDTATTDEAYTQP